MLFHLMIIYNRYDLESEEHQRVVYLFVQRSEQALPPGDQRQLQHRRQRRRRREEEKGGGERERRRREMAGSQSRE